MSVETMRKGHVYATGFTKLKVRITRLSKKSTNILCSNHGESDDQTAKFQLITRVPGIGLGFMEHLCEECAEKLAETLE